MYGVGYNFTPQFAYCTKNVVGSMPVGMDCMSNDAPHWNGSAYATCKEMWIAPVSRCMGTMAVYNEPMAAPATLQISAVPSGKDNVTFDVDSFTPGDYTVDVKLWNAKGKNIPAKINKKSDSLSFNATVEDPSKPYVAVVTLTGKDGSKIRKDVTGYIRK